MITFAVFPSVTVPTPLFHSFLVSFLVDARGGAMRGCRHSGVRVIVPPKSCAQPTRITCRYVKPQRVPNPPPLMEGEALVSRIMELSPVEAKFLGPVILEVPHFGSLRDKEREIIILRLDNGETWREHTLFDSEEAVRDVLNETFESTELSHLEDLHTNRIIRIVTRNFPHFFAVVSRIRQEVHAIGPDGGTVSSTAVPQVQAIFPPNALTKKIRVGLQAQPVDLNGCCKLLGQGVAVSPVVTVEPRRRKFHKAITLSIPAPKAYTQGMVNQYSGNAPTLRLLCSITGGQNRAVWEDVTGSTPLAFVKESVSFTTTVSARFWLMDCRNIADASRMATELYTYMAQVPFMVKFVIFAKRISNIEAKISVFCMTDDKEDKTLEHQEYFTEVAKSRDVEVLEGQDIYLEFIGNLVPVMKSGDQLNMKFNAFRENRLSFIVHVKDQEEPFGRVSFMSEPKCGKGEPPQTPICTLNVSLTGHEIIDNNYRNQTTSSQKSLLLLDRSLNYRDMLNFGYRQAEEIHKADIRLSDICNLLESDWVKLANELDVPETDIDLIKSEYSDKPSQQAMVMLRLWLRSAGTNATGNTIEQALRKINRNDIVEKCIFNLELVTDDIEKAIAKTQLDQSGFDGLKNELDPSSRDSSIKIQNDEKIIDNGNGNDNGDKANDNLINDSDVDNDQMITLSSSLLSPSSGDRANDDDNRIDNIKIITTTTAKGLTEIPFDDSVLLLQQQQQQQQQQNENDNSEYQKVDVSISNQNSDEKYDDDAEINGKQDQETGEILEQYLKTHLTKQIDPLTFEAIRNSDDGEQCMTPPPTPNDAAAMITTTGEESATTTPTPTTTTTTTTTEFINNEKRNIYELIKPASPIAEEKARKIMHEMQEKSRHDQEKHKSGLFIAEEKPIVIKRYPAEEIIPGPENQVEDLAMKCFQVLEQAQQQQQQLQPDDVFIQKSTEDNSMHGGDDGGADDGDDNDDDDDAINLLLQNSSTPVGKLKTIKKSSKVVKKSQIPRPKIDAIDWELAQQQQNQEKKSSSTMLATGKQQQPEEQHEQQQHEQQQHEQQPETNNIKEISSLILADVIDDSNNLTNLSHDADVISPGGSDIEDAIIVQTQDMINNDDHHYDDDDDNNIKSKTITIKSNSKNITEKCRKIYNPDNTETLVLITEEHKINDDGVEVIVRETMSQRKLCDGSLQEPQVHTTVETVHGKQNDRGSNVSSTTPFVCDTKLVADFIKQNPSLSDIFTCMGCSPPPEIAEAVAEAAAAYAASKNNNTTTTTTATTNTTTTTTTITSESSFSNNPSFSKSKTSSTKSLENNITNKTFGSSSDSDIALHEPGIELSEDDVDVDVVEDHEQTEAEFFLQGSLDQPIEPINFQMTERNVDDGGFETVTTTTTTRIVTKGGHKLPDYDVLQQQQQQQQQQQPQPQQLHHSDDYLMHEMLEEISNLNMDDKKISSTNDDINEQKKHLVQQSITPMVINKVTTQFASEPNTTITTAASVTATATAEAETAEELQLDNDQMKALRAEAAAHIDEQLDVALATALSKQHQQQQQQQQQQQEQFPSTKKNMTDQFLTEEKSHH